MLCSSMYTYFKMFALMFQWVFFFLVIIFSDNHVKIIGTPNNYCQ